MGSLPQLVKGGQAGYIADDCHYLLDTPCAGGKCLHVQSHVQLGKVMCEKKIWAWKKMISIMSQISFMQQITNMREKSLSDRMTSVIG